VSVILPDSARCGRLLWMISSPSRCPASHFVRHPSSKHHPPFRESCSASGQSCGQGYGRGGTRKRGDGDGETEGGHGVKCALLRFVLRKTAW